MDVIASTAFGIQVDSQQNPDDPILINAAEVMGTSRRQGIKEKLKFVARVVIFRKLSPDLHCRYDQQPSFKLQPYQ